MQARQRIVLEKCVIERAPRSYMPAQRLAELQFSSDKADQRGLARAWVSGQEQRSPQVQSSIHCVEQLIGNHESTNRHGTVSPWGRRRNRPPCVAVGWGFS